MRYKIADLNSIAEIESIFFVGVKGAGMTPLAIIAHEAGFDIAGSDVEEEYITDKKLHESNIKIFNNFKTTDISSFFSSKNKNKCLVITTGAHKGFDNPQVVWAKENGIKVLSQGQALGQFLDGEIFNREFSGIAISGSHGKTTISSLLASTLRELGEDVSYSVGTGEVFPLGAPGHYGTSEYFIVEADEYASEPVYDKVPKFLYLKPQLAIINNIDFDHPDMYASIENIKNAFIDFAHNISSGGALFINGDDKNLQDIRSEIDKDIRIITYGSSDKCDYRIGKIVSEGLGSKFTLYKKGTEVGLFELNIPGLHNAKNAVSAIALLLEIGFSAHDIRNALRVFAGTKRRFEKVGLASSGALIYDDYAHHPQEITTTLDAFTQSFPDKKIICIFQPHTFSRTEALFEDFARSFNRVDKLLLVPTFKSQREFEKDFSIQGFIEECKKYEDTIFFENFSDVIEYLDKNIGPDSVIITMGAGDVYKISEKIKNA